MRLWKRPELTAREPSEPSGDSACGDDGGLHGGLWYDDAFGSYFYHSAGADVFLPSEKLYRRNCRVCEVLRTLVNESRSRPAWGCQTWEEADILIACTF